ncbi:MAG: aryl-sulfate sulfotransferase [Bacilli bacterium]|nr:aryl-sulfate sulfotransferase [Bacilli bacterium]
MKKKINKKKKTIIISITMIIVGIFLLALNIMNLKYNNNKPVKIEKSLITKQEELEKKFQTNKYTIKKPKIILNPYNNSPLTALILFKTKNKVTPKITIKGKDDLTTYNHKFKKTNNHYLPIYGLYPDKENEILIEYKEKGKKVSKTIKIKTDKLPNDFVKPKSIVSKRSELTNDLYFYTPSSRGYTCAYDINGDVRWYLSNHALWDISRLKNGHMLISTERLINPPYYMTGLYEIDMLGKIYKEYNIKGGYHHDYYELPSGNLLVASDDFNNDDGTVEDYIVELDKITGNIIKKWDLKRILDTDNTGNENWESYDWFHNNSVWYDEKTKSITLSGRHQDAVINIDYNTGVLNWIIGDNTNWPKKYKKYFLKPKGDNFEWQWSQHAAMITPEGYIFLFDNGNNKSKDEKKYVSANNSYSRGVIYKIDEKKKTIEQIWQYGKELGSKFYSPYISDVDYLSKNHYIVHSGGIVYKDNKIQNQPAGIVNGDKLESITKEIKKDEVIFELTLPTNTYRVEKLSLYDNSNFKLNNTRRLGTLGKTQVTKTKYLNLKKIHKIDKDYKKHQIKLTKEEDRLVFKGKFKNCHKVNILLYQNLHTKVYNVPISKTPYTALCVNIFTEEENKEGIEVTKYINNATLLGKYSIYIEIGNKIYNTGKYVEF